MIKSKKAIYTKLIFFLVGIVFFLFVDFGFRATSTNEFCESCHIHPQATQSWKIGPHVYNKSGVKVNCVDCHLPPAGFDMFTAKIITGLRDAYGYFVLDSADINWEQKSLRESAIHHVYKSACLNCHQNLFPSQLSKKGVDAHVYYDQKKDKLRCINCHLETGHFHEKEEFADVEKNRSTKVYNSAAEIDTFINFTETIPGSFVSFELIAITGGSFKMGSPEVEEYRNKNEGPQISVEISDFWMGKTEVSWDEYLVFIKETGREGRTEDQIASITKTNNIDAISGPTPFYGNPDQGWGKGKRPAITMTHFAAKRYCEWLSQKTGKKYRLPTEAEWEYACRSNTEGAYFFDGIPSEYSAKGFWGSIFGVDTSVISGFVIYDQNSRNKTGLPGQVKENPFGLKNMLGNVWEFCSDFYGQNIYASYSKQTYILNPSGPSDGDEFVIKGGSFKSDASEVRIAVRKATQHDAWLLTDPQIPKSLWWYSDCNDVGFRVVCETN